MLLTPLLARLLLVRIVLFFVHLDLLPVVNGQIPLSDSEWEAIRLRQRLHRERRGQASRLAERVGLHVPLPEGPWVQSAADVSLQGNHLCASLRQRGGEGGASIQDCGAVEEGHEFANSQGNLQITSNEPLCENTCIYLSNGICDDGGEGSTYAVCRYGTDCEDCGRRPVLDPMPRGDWNETARDITLEGRQLCARLRRVNLTWSYVCIVLEEGQRFTNMDGEFYLIGQECWVLHCPVGYVQRSLDNLTETLCTTVTCDVERDRDLCCEPAEPCSGVTCPQGQVFNIHRFCPSTECLQERDMEYCCEIAQTCDHLECDLQTGYVPKGNVSDIYCLGPECERSRDLLICCSPAAPCDELLNISGGEECPEGFFLDHTLFCNATECLPSRDLDICCQVSAQCSDFTCPEGYVLLPNASDLLCPRHYCTEELDRDYCCEFREKCIHLTCPPTFVHIRGAADVLCLGASCTLSDDFETCCEPGQLCGNASFSGSCIEGYFLNDDKYCLAVPCLESRDLLPGTCCDPAEPCNSSVACPLGLTLRAGGGPGGYAYCTGAVCDPNSIEDISQCCTNAAHCSSLEDHGSACPWGYVLRNFSAEPDSYCDGVTCEIPRDRDVCCEDAGVCSTEITCPTGYVLKTSTAYCDGPVGSCNLNRDLNNCCDVAASCSTYPVSCPLNYVIRLSRFCLGTACEKDRDLFQCCAIGVAFKFYRFNVTALRNTADGEIIQLADFAFYFDGGQVSFTGATAYTQGVSDSPENEGPSNAIDGDLDTKWNDKSRNVPSLVFEFPIAEVVIDSYTWWTANDASERDPMAWILQGSVDSQVWVNLHIVEENDVTVPTARFTSVGILDVGVPCLAYELIDLVANASSPPCTEGRIIPSGSGCSPLCDYGLTPTPSVLACAHGVLTPETFTCD